MKLKQKEINKEKSTKPKVGSFEKINKINNPLARLTKIEITNIRNEKTPGIKRILKRILWTTLRSPQIW